MSYYDNKLNPYYDNDKLGLEMLSFDEPDMSYEFNTLCFWATPDRRVYSASDSGCSCPTPFEDYEGDNLDKILPLLERVGSVEQGERIFDAWNKAYDWDKGDYSAQHLQVSERNKLSDWLKCKFADNP